MSGPHDWTTTSTNPGHDDARTVEDRNGNSGEVSWSGGVGDVRDDDGNSIGTVWGDDSSSED